VETERTTCGELGPCGGFGEEEENFLTAGPAQLLKARGVLWQDGLAVPWDPECRVVCAGPCRWQNW
jgi:hypothetical protein